MENVETPDILKFLADQQMIHLIQDKSRSFVGGTQLACKHILQSRTTFLATNINDYWCYIFAFHSQYFPKFQLSIADDEKKNNFIQYAWCREESLSISKALGEI